MYVWCIVHDVVLGTYTMIDEEHEIYKNRDRERDRHVWVVSKKHYKKARNQGLRPRKLNPQRHTRAQAAGWSTPRAGGHGGRWGTER